MVNAIAGQEMRRGIISETPRAMLTDQDRRAIIEFLKQQESVKRLLTRLLHDSEA